MKAAPGNNDAHGKLKKARSMPLHAAAPAPLTHLYTCSFLAKLDGMRARA